MANTTQRSLVGMRLDLFKLFGKPYNVLENTTLNEKFSNLKVVGKLNSYSTYPILQYYGFGCGGNDAITGSSTPTYSRHSPNDCNLFNLAPLKKIALGQDETLHTTLHDTRYRMLEKSEIANTGYLYLKKLDMDNDIYIDDTFTKVTAKNGTARLSSYSVKDIKDALSPSPIVRGIDYENLENKNIEYGNVYAHVRITMSKDELEEMRDACKSKGYSTKITEIGLFTGIDMCDALVTELYISIDVSIDILAELNKKDSTGFTRFIEVGGSEPLVLKDNRDAD